MEEEGGERRGRNQKERERNKWRGEGEEEMEKTRERKGRKKQVQDEGRERGRSVIMKWKERRKEGKESREMMGNLCNTHYQTTLLYPQASLH